MALTAVSAAGETAIIAASGSAADIQAAADAVYTPVEVLYIFPMAPLIWWYCAYP